MQHDSSRRGFLRGAVLGAAGSVLLAQSGESAAQQAEAGAAAEMPQGKIGGLTISRLLLGGNLITHYTHSRDLQYVYNLCAHYNTDEKIVQTLALSEKHGINTLVVHTVPRTMSVLKDYRRSGGKMQWIICPTEPVEPDMVKYTRQCRELADEGTEAIYLWGVTADKLCAEGKLDLMKKAVDVAKEQGVPSGVGAHDLEVIKACEKNNVGADFYIKTFHHHNYPSGPKPEELKGAYNEFPGYWCKSPQDTIDFMKTIEKPWLAFKVMAAGAIPPKDAFAYAYSNGADHILAGMFDFEIAEDAAIARDAVAHAKRERAWKS